jgi:predicted DCC family thiol-disulfide oxidoreductase YuxK
MNSPHPTLAPGKTVQVFHDGDCPLCNAEINLLKRLDRKERIEFTDIAAADFLPEPLGLGMSDLMDRIHGRLPDGSLIEGVEVFRQLYSAIGLSPLVALTRLPGLSHALDWGYRMFAKNRLKWTGRCSDGVCNLPRRTAA